jgi:hypothetical protein
LVDEHRRALRRASSHDDVPSWVAVRSASVALARYGFQDPLHSFVETGLESEIQALANLNYWAYWVGEVGDTYTDDTFMRSNDPTTTGGSRLLEHLIGRLNHSPDQAELYVHTLWQLLIVQPSLPGRHPALRQQARAEIETMISTSLTTRASQQLSDVAYALRLS